MGTTNKNIQNILEKYWAGDSSLEEERTLTDYFNSSNIDPEFNELIPYFSYLQNEKTVEINLEEEVMSKIQQTEKKGKVIFLGWQKAVAVAASLLLLVTLAVTFNNYQKKNIQADLAMADTFQSPEEALAQTKAALLYLSSRMNKGTELMESSLSKTESLDILNQ